MLSVLIPIYNFNALNLVEQLHQQLIQSKIVFEIICIDDSSDPKFNEGNREIANFSNCRFQMLETNIGRSKIRNLLAKKATFDWLLFVDSDVLPENNNFIHLYREILDQKLISVVCGGISYLPELPDKTKRLRWKYGQKREQLPVNIRKKDPNKNFFSANFLIRKTVFIAITFDESLINYGHEDTLFAIALKTKLITVDHIHNPVIHLGLDSNTEFLHKTKQAVSNAFVLQQSGKLSENDLRLLKKHKQLERKNTIGLFKFGYKIIRSLVERNLNSAKPSLMFFDLYRLNYLIHLNETKT